MRHVKLFFFTFSNSYIFVCSHIYFNCFILLNINKFINIIIYKNIHTSFLLFCFVLFLLVVFVSPSSSRKTHLSPPRPSGVESQPCRDPNNARDTWRFSHGTSLVYVPIHEFCWFPIGFSMNGWFSMVFHVGKLNIPVLWISYGLLLLEWKFLESPQNYSIKVPVIFP